MRAFLLSLVAILALISATQAQTQTQPQVLRMISAAGKTATSTNVTVNLVHQERNITATVKWGTDTTYSLGTQTLVVTRLSPTYSPIFELTGLVHGTKYFVQVQAATTEATETKTLEFVQNLSPTAKADAFTLEGFTGTRMPVLRNDRDPDNVAGAEPVDELSLKRVTAPSFGRAEIVGKAIVYSPGPAFLGHDQFEYVVTDSNGETSRATVTVSGLGFALFGPHGLLLEDAAGTPAGYLRLDVARGGTFTGSLKMDGRSYALMGRFDSQGKFLGYARSSSGVVPVGLEISQEGGVTRIRAKLANGQLGADEATSTHTIASMAELAGRYTIELPAGSAAVPDDDEEEEENEDNDSSEELGIGWAIMEIDNWGDVDIEGETADRQKFSASGVLSGSPAGAVVSFYAQQKNGVLSGTLTLGEKVTGDLQWQRKDGNDEAVTVSANGGRWFEPEEGRRALATDEDDAGRMTISISGGNVPDFERELRISEDVRVTVLEEGSDSLDMKIDRDNGTFKGKFRQLDDLDRRCEIRGGLLQNERRGSGVFEGDGKPGRVEISLGSPEVPAPQPDPTPQPDQEPDPQPDPLFPGFNDPGLENPGFEFGF
ncbi:MAG: Ig-like domain-containing protein [Chthoniobacteraceae bacterium]